jgi:hypothetical protein
VSKIIISISRMLLVFVFVFLLAACQSLPRAEYSTFVPMNPNQRIMNQVKIRWEVRDDVAEFCAKAKGMGKEQAFLTPPIACAIWQTARRECTVVTGSSTTHTALGHEIRHCFEGHFH